jgi:hypothetical protein
MRPPFAVPVATPVAQPAPVRSAAPPPMPHMQQQQPQQVRHTPASGIAVADFSSAAPARLQPGNTPSVLSTSHWPAPQQAGQITQQHRQAQRIQQQQQQLPQYQQQQQQQRPGSALTAAAAAQPPQQDGPWSCSVCTYEHAGPEAEFLFCAMCSSQRPV